MVADHSLTQQLYLMLLCGGSSNVSNTLEKAKLASYKALTIMGSTLYMLHLVGQTFNLITRQRC